jgi:hypothetical protein
MNFSMRKYRQFLNELHNDAVRKSEVIVAFEVLYSDTHRCHLELFLGGGNYECPRLNRVGGIWFRSPTETRALDE